MAEMSSHDFEQRFAARLQAYAAIPVAPVAADEVARAAASTRSRGQLTLRLPVGAPAVPWVLLALAVAIAGGLLAGALLRQVRPMGAMPMVLALEDGLYVAGELGDERRLLRGDGSFVSPRWSPGGDRIAVVHGPPLPAQFGTAGAPPLTGAPFDLVPAELLVLDGGGSTRFAVRGPILDYAWAPVVGDGGSLLAVGTTDGQVTVYDAAGSVVTEFRRDEPVTDAALEPSMQPPGLAWASSRRLLIASGSRVLALDLDTSGSVVSRVVADAGTGRVNALAAAPDGRVFAFVVADCVARCAGEARGVRLPEAGGPTQTGAAPVGRVMLTGVEASASLSWSDDGRHLLAWPMIADAAGGMTRPAPSAPEVQNRDVVAAWTRLAPDGSGRLIVLNQYSNFNDRHYDAWLVDPDGTAVRVGKRSLGFDVRVPPAP